MLVLLTPCQNQGVWSGALVFRFSGFLRAAVEALGPTPEKKKKTKLDQPNACAVSPFAKTKMSALVLCFFVVFVGSLYFASP